MTRKPRNVENNNPLNIKESANWTGERALNLDTTFEEFKTPEHGFRAGFIILLQYLERGDNTINAIVNKWAPSGTEEKNHTQAYVEYVADKMQMSPVEYISPVMLPELMLHMSVFEGSKGHFTIEQARQGAVLAMKENFVIARLHRLGEVAEAIV
ncbi:MAG: hypothetical protein RPS47_05570 [Colwellia sp.]